MYPRYCYSRVSHNTHHIAAPLGQLVTTNNHCRLLHQNTGAAQRGTAHQRAICWHCMADNAENIATAIMANILRRSIVIAKTCYGSGETTFFFQAPDSRSHTLYVVHYTDHGWSRGGHLGDLVLVLAGDHSLAWETPLFPCSGTPSCFSCFY